MIKEFKTNSKPITQDNWTRWKVKKQSCFINIFIDVLIFDITYKWGSTCSSNGYNMHD